MAEGTEPVLKKVKRKVNPSWTDEEEIVFMNILIDECMLRNIQGRALIDKTHEVIFEPIKYQYLYYRPHCYCLGVSFCYINLFFVCS